MRKKGKNIYPHRGSNPGPLDYKSAALPTELHLLNFEKPKILVL